MRVVKLEAENFKRLSAVEITPDPDASTVTIAGRNAQGKSSVIDALWSALAGSAAAKGTSTSRPIRDGESSARVTVDLGDIVVTRTWTGDKTALKVESKDGARYTSPQRMLDEMIGRLSFDPLAFASLSAKAQQAELLALVELPFDPELLADERATAFSERTDVGRLVKQLQGQLDGFGEIPDGTPDEVQSVSVLVEELDAAVALQSAAERAAGAVAAARDSVAYAEAELAKAEALLAQNTRNYELALGAQAEVADPPDVEAIRSRIAGLDAVNAAVREKQSRGRVAEQLESASADYERLTARIRECDETRSAGLAGAEFPVEGLGFDDEGVTFRGVPFAQASAAERLRVSVAMAMALNPKVRIIRITDGSLLDEDNLALIESMAADNEFQVWVEVVGDRGGQAVVIEDGAVKS